MIVSGTPVPSEKLAGTKLFDAIIEGDLLDGAVAFAEKVADVRPLPLVRNIPLKDPRAPGFLAFARNTVDRDGQGLPRAQEVRGRGRGGGHQALRGGAQLGAGGLRGPDADARVAGAAPRLLRRARRLQDPRRPRGHAHEAHPGRRRSSAPGPWAAASP